MPKISVIVPVYKVEPYLRRCVDSILAQSFSDFELILVDDGSPDNCGAICDEYAKQDSRIRVIHRENGGLSAARNSGLEIAAGEYIMFCDSADTVTSEWCAQMLCAIQEYPDALIACGFNRLDEFGAVKSEHRMDPGEYDKEQYFLLCFPGLAGSSCNKIYRKSLIQTKQLKFDTNRKYAEDVVFNLEYLDHADRIVVVGGCLYNYYSYTSRNTLSTGVSYFQYRDIYSIRLKYIAEQYKKEFCRTFWFHAWAKFCEALNDGRTRRVHRIRMAREIARDAVFQELLEQYGKTELDRRSFVLLKHERVGLFCMLQFLAKIKGKRS